MSEPVVICDGLVHIFKARDLEVVALQGLNLEVAPGEVIGVVGRSGSGKTTLMNILAGMEPPSAGRVSVAGQDLARMTEREREQYRREVVGYVWQHSQVNLWAELDALENVEIPMLARGVRGSRRAREAMRLLAALGLAERAHRRPAELSGGETQRLALAVGLANGPALLLAHEPTPELDGVGARALLEDLTELLRERSTGAVIVTHDKQVERYVDRVIQIRDGRTSTEPRWVERQGALVADELVIMDRAGRLQLPKAHLEKLGLRDRVRVRVEGDSLRILPADERNPP